MNIFNFEIILGTFQSPAMDCENPDDGYTRLPGFLAMRSGNAEVHVSRKCENRQGISSKLSEGQICQKKICEYSKKKPCLNKC